MSSQYWIENKAKSMSRVFQKSKTPYKHSLPGFPADGIFNTLEIFFLQSNRIVQDTLVTTVKF